MTVIVFSRDRAMQLDAFLRSYAQMVANPPRVCVLYRATTARHETAYLAVLEQHASTVVARRQGDDFKADVLALMPSSGVVAFFVDDQVFVRPWAAVELPGLSLRLAPHLTLDYNTWDAVQPVPPLRRVPSGLLAWTWRDGALSWGYPLSLDGHLYDLTEVRPMVERLSFHSPNTLESALQVYVPKFLSRSGFCYAHSKVVNVPWNRVQDDWVNRCEGRHSADDLLDAWERGFRISLQPLTGVRNEGVHQEFSLVLEAR